MRSKTFPKENQKKLNETIKDLRAMLRQKDNEIKFLRSEINNIMKPSRDRKQHEEIETQTHEEWKVDFLKRFKRDVLGEKG